MSQLDYAELEVPLAFLYRSAPDDPACDYRGWTEITQITFDGKSYDARDFPREFVKALEAQLRSGQ